ncbi:hypothetical protein FZ103_18455 [Streptomonospora sp. PA3]|uniref:hypothetical protein n=1 Tax=Streptomonospora sp. PA3 TaxID=2607326 RepID=UPI0012DF80A3|nr:hypothetical protein [Streptomonospora sp. PA3]MUL43124.1 hypothetical protein [Streptomonospora sp. PA3]
MSVAGFSLLGFACVVAVALRQLLRLSKVRVPRWVDVVLIAIMAAVLIFLYALALHNPELLGG